MADKKNAVIKAGLWYTVSNFLTRGAIFLTTPIFTRLMSKADIGAYANLNSWHQVLLPIVTLELTTSLGLARFDYKDELDEYTSSTLVIGTAITAFFYLIVLLNMEFFEKLFTLDAYAIHVMFIYMMVYPAMLMFQSRNMFEYKYKASTAISISSMLLSVALALILTIYSENNKLFARIMGYFVPLILFCVVLYIYILVKGKKVSFKYFKYAVVLGAPMVWHSLAIHLLGTGDRIIITNILGKEANALYTVAFTTGYIANMLWNAMNNAWSPWSQERMNTGETDEMKKASHGYILLYAAVIIMLLLVSPEILLLMGGREYAEAIYVLPPVIVGCMCQFLYSLYVNAEFYLKKQTRIAVSTLAAAGLNIGLNIWLIPKFGYVAAAYTTLFGYLCLLLFHYTSLRLLKKTYWYDNKFNFLVMLFFLLMVPVSNFLYGHTVLRYVIIGIAAAAACGAIIKFWDEIKDFLKKRVFS